MAPSVTNWLREKAQVRRLRRQAYATTRVGSRFGVDGSTHADLALLRALTLERELRCASLTHSRESVAAMARGIIESVLRGLYVLAQPDAVPERLGAEAIGHFRKFSFFGDPAVRDLFQNLGEVFVEEDHLQRGMPGLRQVAEAVDAHHDFQIFSEQRLGAYLYHDWYLPLSNFSVHPSGAALSRHYKFRSRTVLKRPWQVIPRRGAIRMSDGAIAFLLVAILESRNENTRWVRGYAERQVAMANIPIVILLARMALGQGLGTLVRITFAGVRNRVAFDPGVSRERRLSAIRALLGAAGPDVPGDELDETAAKFLDAVDEAMDGSASAPTASQNIAGSS